MIRTCRSRACVPVVRVVRGAWARTWSVGLCAYVGLSVGLMEDMCVCVGRAAGPRVLGAEHRPAQGSVAGTRGHRVNPGVSPTSRTRTLCGLCTLLDRAQGLGDRSGGQERAPVWERPMHTPKHHTLAKTLKHKHIEQRGHVARGTKWQSLPPRNAPAPPRLPSAGGHLPCTPQPGTQSCLPTHHLERLLGLVERRDPSPPIPNNPESTPGSTFHTEGGYSPQPGACKGCRA